MTELKAKEEFDEIMKEIYAKDEFNKKIENILQSLAVKNAYETLVKEIVKKLSENQKNTESSVIIANNNENIGVTLNVTTNTNGNKSTISNSNRRTDRQNAGENRGVATRGESLLNNDGLQNASPTRSTTTDLRANQGNSNNNVQEISTEPRTSNQQGNIQWGGGFENPQSTSITSVNSGSSIAVAGDASGQLLHTDNNLRGGRGGWGDIRERRGNIDGGFDEPRHQQAGNISNIYGSGQLDRGHTTTRSVEGLGLEAGLLGGRGARLSADENEVFNLNVRALETLNSLLDSTNSPNGNETNALKAFSGAGGRFSNAIQKIRKENIDDERLTHLNDLLKSIDSKIPKTNFTDRPLDIGIFYARSDTAYYTPQNIVRAMTQAVENFSLPNNANILEPSVGSGKFLDSLKQKEFENYTIHAVELDRLTSAIAQKLYPKAHIENTGFQNSKAISRKGSYDLVIGNPPYSADRIEGHSMTDYFLLKGIENLQDNGLSLQIVSHNFLDKDSEAKKQIAEQAEFLGAVRLPNTAFGADTSVTTDIVAFRKVPESERINLDKSWVQVQDSEFDGLKVSSYFTNNPNRVLGEFVEESTQFGKQLGVKDTGKFDSSNFDFTPYMIKESNGLLFSNPPLDLSNAYVQNNNDINYIEKPIGSIFMQDGKVYRSVNLGNYVNRNNISSNVEIDLAEETAIREPNWVKSKKALQGRIDSYKKLMPQFEALQNTLSTLRHLEANTNDEAKIALLRNRLNQQFNELTKNSGGSLYDKRGNVRKEFSLFYLLDDTSFEIFSLQDKKGQRAEIFEKRMAKPYDYVKSADSLESAVNISKNEQGKISLERVSELLNQDINKTQNDLLESKIMFMNIDGELIEAGKFLSGDVKTKLENFRDKETKALRFNENEDIAKHQKVAYEALKEVIPEDIELQDIAISLGSKWISPDIYKDFLQNHLGLHIEKFTYVEGASYEIKISQYTSPTYEDYTFSLSKEFAQNTGKSKDNALLYLTKMFNNATLEESRQVKQSDGSSKTYRDEVGTATLERFKMQITQSFKEFIESNPEYAEVVQQTYNELFNRTVARTYSGAHLTLIGKNEDITLRPHQQNAVQRILDSKSTLLAHDVGTGKTYTMVASALEAKRLGIAKKPMIITPNNVAPQLATEARKLYPNAKIKLVNAISQKRKNIELENLKNNDYDLIVTTYTAFESMNVSEKLFIDYCEKEIAQYEKIKNNFINSGEGNKRDLNSITKKIEKVAEKMKKYIEKTAKSDSRVFFDDLDVNMLLFDEAQMIKNLPIITAQKNVRGISTQTSNRAIDAYMKIQHLKKENNSKVVFATGTPITNYISDMYVLQRYLDDEGLKEQGLLGFDDWCKMFALSESSFERKASGEFKQTSRMKYFQNLPELKKRFFSVADSVTKEDMKKDLQLRGLKSAEPEVERYNILIERSNDQDIYQESLKKRAKQLEGKRITKGGDNHLVIMNDGKKASLDMRIINPKLERDPNGKVAKCAEIVLKQYEQYNDFKGTQLIFCDSSVPKGKALNEEQIAKITNEIIALEDELDDFDGSEEKFESKMKKLEDLKEKLARGTIGFSIYNDMKDLLIKKGIPENEIAFIHDYNTEIRANELREKINNGEIRVLLGSTKKMGAGSNFQQRLTAIHHLDFDWTPANMEQREGRIIRQGNDIHEELGEDFKARIFTYATKQSVDSVVLQTLGTKKRIIMAIRDKNVQIRALVDDSEENIFLATQAATDENAELLIESMETEKAILFLQTAIDGNKKLISNKKIEIDRLENTSNDLEAKEKFLGEFAKNENKGFFVIDGEKFDIDYFDSKKPEESKKIRTQIRDELNQLLTRIAVNQNIYSGIKTIGKIGGVELFTKYHKATNKVSFYVGNNIQEGVEFATLNRDDLFRSNIDFVRRYSMNVISESAQEKLKNSKEINTEKLETAKKTLEKLQAKNFEEEEKILQEKQLRLTELNVFLRKESAVDTQIAQEKYGENYKNIIDTKIGAEVEKIKEANRLASADEVIASIDFSPKSSPKIQNTQECVEEYFTKERPDTPMVRIKYISSSNNNESTSQSVDLDNTQPQEAKNQTESKIDALQNVVSNKMEEMKIQVSDFKNKENIYQKVEVLKENQNNIKKAKRSRTLF